MDKITKVLKDLRDILLHKRKSLQGVLDTQGSIEHRQSIDRKIKEVTEKINEVNDCITLRMSETAERATHHVPID